MIRLYNLITLHNGLCGSPHNLSSQPYVQLMNACCCTVCSGTGASARHSRSHGFTQWEAAVSQAAYNRIRAAQPCLTSSSNHVVGAQQLHRAGTRAGHCQERVRAPAPCVPPMATGHHRMPESSIAGDGAVRRAGPSAPSVHWLWGLCARAPQNHSAGKEWGGAQLLGRDVEVLRHRPGSGPRPPQRLADLNAQRGAAGTGAEGLAAQLLSGPETAPGRPSSATLVLKDHDLHTLNPSCRRTRARRPPSRGLPASTRRTAFCAAPLTAICSDGWAPQGAATQIAQRARAS
jgi:hypothetical protein